MCVCVCEGVIKPRGSYHLQAQAQQRLVHDQEEDESFFVVVSFGVPAVVADQLVQGGIRDANPFPISIVSRGGGSGRAGRDTRGLSSVRVFSPSTHLHPRRQEGKGRKGAVMSANEDGSTGCILSSYHL